MPFEPDMSPGEFGDLLPQSSQRKDPPLRFGPETDPIKVAALVAQLQEVSLVKNAKLLILARVECPLCRLGTSAPMMLIVKEITIAIPLSWHRMNMTGITTDGHG